MTGTYTHVTGVYKQLKSFIELKLTNQKLTKIFITYNKIYQLKLIYCSVQEISLFIQAMMVLA